MDGWAGRQGERRVLGGNKLYISASNWGEGVSTKAGADLEEVGMKLFSEGRAGLEWMAMKV